MLEFFSLTKINLTILNLILVGTSIVLIFLHQRNYRKIKKVSYLLIQLKTVSRLRERLLKSKLRMQFISSDGIDVSLGLNWLTCNIYMFRTLHKYNDPDIYDQSIVLLDQSTINQFNFEDLLTDPTLPKSIVLELAKFNIFPHTKIEPFIVPSDVVTACVFGEEKYIGRQELLRKVDAPAFKDWETLKFTSHQLLKSIKDFLQENSTTAKK